MNLRETFEFLAVEAGDPPQEDLAGRALAQLRRDRAVKGLSAAVVVATAAVLALVWPGGTPRTPPLPADPPGVPALPPGHELTFGGYRIGGYDNPDQPGAGTHLLDPRTGTYRTFPVDALVSPDGRKAVYPKPLTADSETGPLPTDQVTIADLVTGQEQKIALPWGATDFAWSPDSGTVVGTVLSAAADPVTGGSRRLGFVLLRPGTEQPTFVPVNTGGCGGPNTDDAFGWRGGEVYGLGAGTAPNTCVLTYYGVDGAAHGSLPSPGVVMSVSPDGSLLLVRNLEKSGPPWKGGVGTRYRVVDATTGRRLGAFPAYGSTGVPLAWMDGRHLFTQQGVKGTRARLVASDVNGRVTRVLTRWGPYLDLQFIPVGP
ncbi:MAG: hypothetical protein ACJ73S_23790 [Mycobacteriales bacterium]